MAQEEHLNYLNGRIDILHLELTSRCNLLCPMCARTNALDHDSEILKKRDDLELIDSSPEMLEKLMQDLYPNVPLRVFINGNFGDPIMYPYLLDVIRMFKSYGVPNISFSTNGSAQTEDWWRELASIMTKPDKVVFAIDGLEDTNHLYRINSKWNVIMRNVKAFIGAGGRARWDYIGFAHNEHQVEEAKALAEELGFFLFRYKRSNRYVIPKNYTVGQDHVEEETLVTKKEIKFIAKQSKSKSEIILAEPKSATSNTTQNIEHVLQKHKTLENYISTTDIDCQTRGDNSLFIDYKGYLWPCCWQGHYYSSIGEDKGSPKRIEDRIALENKYGKDWNNLHHHGIYDILKTDYYKKDLVDSWNPNKERLYICGKTCGNELDFRGNSKKNYDETQINE